MKIKFCGAARNVTGSQHLLEINGKKLLLECGLFQGRREESFQMNRKFLYNPEEIKCVILSHAHIDHSGNLPTLYMKGFRGSVYSTPATRDLCSIMLQDSAHIQEKDVEFVNKKRKKNNEPLFNPLYTINEAKMIIAHFKSIPYSMPINIDGFDNKVSVKFTEAGHILGSAQITLEITENGKSVRLGFSGDLGRKNLPILKDPEFIGDVDYFICESTYGNRIHEDAEKMTAHLKEVILEAYETYGKIIVPAFSVERTQEVIHTINKLKSLNEIPDFPVYIDSPLSVNATEIFRLHPECYDEETYNLISSGVDVFGGKNIFFIKDAEESKKLNNRKEFCMIISASGMCEAGRILHHLANNIENPNNIILIIGFMAEHTLGRRLVESKDIYGNVVKIFGDEYKVNARIRILNSFSAHADRNELLEYFDNFDKRRQPEIFLIHGENQQQESLKEALGEKGFSHITIPYRGEEFEI